MTDPVLVDIAAALATESAPTLHALVRSKLSHGGRETDALDAATGAGPDSDEVVFLAEELQRAASEDPSFAASLRAEWNAAQVTVHRTTVSNKVTGDVTGPVIQARDIHGGIHLGG